MTQPEESAMGGARGAGVLIHRPPERCHRTQGNGVRSGPGGPPTPGEGLLSEVLCLFCTLKDE